MGAPSTQGEGRRRGGEIGKHPNGAPRSWPRPASSRPKSRRFAAVGLEMRLRARSCPCGAIHLLAPYKGAKTKWGHLPPRGKAF